MINEKRIRMMTKLANFEQQNYPLVKDAKTYYRSDYIGVHLLKNLLRISLVYFIGLGLWACYHIDDLMVKINTMDIMGIGRNMLIFYGVVVGVYLIITYIIYSIKFYKAEKKLQTYRNMLDRLVMEYENETGGRRRRERQRGRLGGTVNDSTRRS